MAPGEFLTQAHKNTIMAELINVSVLQAGAPREQGAVLLCPRALPVHGIHREMPSPALSLCIIDEPLRAPMTYGLSCLAFPWDCWDPWLAVARWRRDAFSVMECQGTAGSPTCRVGWGLQTPGVPGTGVGTGTGVASQSPGSLAWLCSHTALARGICIPQRISLIRRIDSGAGSSPTQPRELQSSAHPLPQH